MKPIDEKKETVRFWSVSRDEEGRKRVEKMEVSTQTSTLSNTQRRSSRTRASSAWTTTQPTASESAASHQNRGTTEGSDDVADNELDLVPPAIDERDPNYVDEEEEGKLLRGEKSDVAGLVVGEVEVPKVAEAQGVTRVELSPQLNA